MARPTVKELRTDPKYAEEAAYARDLTREIIKDELILSKEKPKEGLFGFLFEKPADGGIKWPWEW